MSQEHPKVRFSNKLYTELLFFEEATKNFYSYEYSTAKPVRDQAENLLAPPSIESVGVDRDKDGVYDQWNITMRIRKPQLDYKLDQANVILAFDYRTDETVKMQMETFAVA